MLPCDVSSDQDIASVFTKIEQEFGGLDFRRPWGGVRAARRALRAFSQTTREGFRMALDISAYSLIALTPRRRAADGTVAAAEASSR